MAKKIKPIPSSLSILNVFDEMLGFFSNFIVNFLKTLFKNNFSYLNDYNNISFIFFILYITILTC